VTLPILLSVPHGGRDVPADLSDQVAASPDEILRDGDSFSDAIYALDGHVRRVVTASVARAVVDMNRAPEDRPPANPDGVVKSHTCHGELVWKDDEWRNEALAQSLIDRYHWPYHRALEVHAADPAIRLGIDCHTMNPVPPTASTDRRPRPLFCLSNGHGETCDPSQLENLAETLAHSFEIDVSQVGINDPFGGGYICRRHGRNPAPWVQLEMNKALYLTDPWFDPRTQTLSGARILELQQRLANAFAALLA
jgi:formiminoglutamase